MKILITGVAGFLGSHLADRMVEQGNEVVGIDNLIGGELCNIDPRVSFHEGDCGDLPLMCQLSRGCDVVFHAACTAHDGLSVFSPDLITRNTFQITMSVLSAAIQNNVKRFVFCSSMSRYGCQDTMPFTEDMECNPQVPYSIAKVAAEQVIQKLARVYNYEYVIVVPHNIIGPRQKYNDPYRNVAGIMMNRMLKGQQPIIYGDGSHKRCFSFIKDVIYCIERCMTQSNLNTEVINVGPDEEFVTINELARVIAKIMDFKLQPIYVAERPLEVKYAMCSADKARRLLGYETKTSLEEGLRKMYEYISTKGSREFEYALEVEIRNEKTPSPWLNKTM